MLTWKAFTGRRGGGGGGREEGGGGGRGLRCGGRGEQNRTERSDKQICNSLESYFLETVILHNIIGEHSEHLGEGIVCRITCPIAFGQNFNELILNQKLRECSFRSVDHSY